MLSKTDCKEKTIFQKKQGKGHFFFAEIEFMWFLTKFNISSLFRNVTITLTIVKKILVRVNILLVSAIPLFIKF